MTTPETPTLDIATLPLADGRQVAVPLLALAEVQQYAPDTATGETLGSLYWRGHDLQIQSLEEFCGLPAQPREKLCTVGIFRAKGGETAPFRALAFCGLAAHRRVTAEELRPMEPPQQGRFSAAATVEDQTYLIPDLPGMLYT